MTDLEIVVDPGRKYFGFQERIFKFWLAERFGLVTVGNLCQKNYSGPVLSQYIWPQKVFAWFL
jgi:hypothetical protein